MKFDAPKRAVQPLRLKRSSQAYYHRKLIWELTQSEVWTTLLLPWMVDAMTMPPLEGMTSLEDAFRLNNMLGQKQAINALYQKISRHAESFLHIEVLPESAS